MSRLRVAPIVEGHGEYASIRILLDRIWCEHFNGDYIEVLKPTRQPKGRLKKEDGLANAIRFAREKLTNPPASSESDPALILILIDADNDCPGEWGPRLLEWGKKSASDLDIACVLAVIDYETWFAATAESLKSYLDLPSSFVASVDAEKSRHGKRWVEGLFRGTKYSPTTDQPRMTSAMDLAICREHSPSFNKLCCEFEQRLQKN